MKTLTTSALLSLCFSLVLAAESVLAKDANATLPPGVVIDHVPASAGMYVGSPSIAVLPNGDYVASHDLFGPKSDERGIATTRIFSSADCGKTWCRLPDVRGAFWSSLFVHRGQLYLMGPNKYGGALVIRRSTDGGKTWTEPKDKSSGLLFDDVRYHTATMPVVVHNGRIWRAVEDLENPGRWAAMFRARMVSAPEDADLLKASNWTISKPLKWNMTGGWLEGNAVVTPDKKIVNILRVHSRDENEKAAIVHISSDGKAATFDPVSDLVEFPGGSKKFTIRFDAETNSYWTLSNYVLPEDRNPSPHCTRNTLVLASSPDLRKWTVNAVVLRHPDPKKHGFQYVDWQFDGDDLIAVSRTAFDDAEGGAHSWHDANYLTFHRIPQFRTLGNTSP